MITTDAVGELLQRLDQIRHLCPEMRLGQILATLSLLVEDSTGRSLWETEDEELRSALERFAADLARRQCN